MMNDDAKMYSVYMYWVYPESHMRSKRIAVFNDVGNAIEYAKDVCLGALHEEPNNELEHVFEGKYFDNQHTSSTNVRIAVHDLPYWNGVWRK